MSLEILVPVTKSADGPSKDSTGGDKKMSQEVRKKDGRKRADKLEKRGER